MSQPKKPASDGHTYVFGSPRSTRNPKARPVKQARNEEATAEELAGCVTRLREVIDSCRRHLLTVTVMGAHDDLTRLETALSLDVLPNKGPEL